MTDIEEVLKERGSRYGDFNEHARITQSLKNAMTSGPSWSKCTPSQREALEMIAHKIGRIVNGDPDYLDSWVDIGGYTELAIKDIKHEKSEFAQQPVSVWRDIDVYVNGEIIQLTKAEVERYENTGVLPFDIQQKLLVKANQHSGRNL